VASVGAGAFGGAPCELAPFPAAAAPFAAAGAAPGSGVVPFTTLAAESVGTDSLSFFTRIEMRRFHGSKGLALTRNIWSA
jgi:hypothetical protein